MGFALIPAEVLTYEFKSFLPNGVHHNSLTAYDRNLSIIPNHFVHNSFSLELFDGLFIHGFSVCCSSLFEFFFFLRLFFDEKKTAKHETSDDGILCTTWNITRCVCDGHALSWRHQFKIYETQFISILIYANSFYINYQL